MAPTLAKPFHRPGWVYDEKYDGARVRLISRNNVDHTERLRELAAAVAALKAPTLILDGEVCVFEQEPQSTIRTSIRSRRANRSP